ncbi:hypothetical protein [Paraburkholderia phytofirmans]|uniref:Uncharacterized protein n=1 Tax=Paraburkholderia phytofirmans (strain DSM 17436 / LMG 22146 / PsJN) TaxID=398527 RepID=B2TGV3_PARPJ|nr:hypothetical protein [Paraburkholderia phytofirmans]ACD21669.1 conserved hypothetical protein [Paraburkholderia phytofirmans PsJN]
MNKTNVLALARREAAASIQWPEKTALLLNPDPAVRKRLKKAGIVCGVLALLLLIGNEPHGPIQHWAKSVDNREMRPSMESAMKAGSLAAGTWLAMHYADEYPGLLQKESDAGDPSAMFLVGRALMQADHPERYLKVDRSLTSQQLHAKGLELVRKAAASGSQEALMFVLNHGGV